MSISVLPGRAGGWLAGWLAGVDQVSQVCSPVLQAELAASGGAELAGGGAAAPGDFVVLGCEVQGALAGQERRAAGVGLGGVLLAVGGGRDVHDVAPALLVGGRVDRVDAVGVPPHGVAGRD